MAEYHVGCGLFGIYAGTLNKNKTMWTNKSDVTDEAITAVREYMIDELLGGKECQKATQSGYEWDLSNGNIVQLIVKIKSAEKKDAQEAES